jgi:hypothetical protein
MNPRIAKILGASAFAAILAGPALAQIPFPNLEVHITNGAPPRPRYERRPARPGADYVWVGGFYDWRDGRWDWTPGRWDRPERRDVRWVAPRYVRDSDSYRYEPGHWSNQRLAEGSDYREWHEKHHNDRGHDRRWDREHERDDRDRHGDERDHGR